MTQDPATVISALLDGESVDTQDALNALDSADGRDAVAAFLRVRVLIADDGTTPSPAFYAHMRNAAPVIRRRHVRRQHAVVIVAIAALLVLAFLSGSMLRVLRGEPNPPRATRVIAFQPGVDWQTLPTPQTR